VLMEFPSEGRGRARVRRGVKLLDNIGCFGEFVYSIGFSVPAA